MVKTKKIRKILVPRRYINVLMEEYGKSQASIYYALNYTLNSEDAKKIREDALEKYEGVEVNQIVLA